MKTEDLIREYIKTHERGEGESKRDKIEKPVKPVRPVSPRGK